MKLAIKTTGVELDATLIAHIERRAEFALSHLAMYVQSVKLSLSDENGPRGGVDKRCRLQVQLADEAPLLVTERSDNAHAAISRAFGVVRHLASRTIQRRLRRARSVMPRHGLAAPIVD